MKRKSKRKKVSTANFVFPITLFVATLIMSIGYAAVNSITMDISGTAFAGLGEGIFITSVDYNESESKNIVVDNSDIVGASETYLNSKVELSSTTNDTYITYSVTVLNNTNYKYTYVGTIYDEDFYDNANITFSVGIDPFDFKLASGDTVTFNLTFKYSDGVTASDAINVLNSCLNFKFIRTVNYIEGTGTQYIDTGYKPDDNTNFSMAISLNEVDAAQAIYGTRDKMDDGTYHNLFVHNNNSDGTYKLRFDEDGTWNYIDLTYNDGNIIYISKTSDNVTFITNGSVDVVAGVQSDWSLDSTIYIFSQNDQSEAETRHGLMKLYNFKIYQGQELVRDFIPALDDSGIACLYDLITNKFYYNAGSGSFNYSETYMTLDYIGSTGTQYIDTGKVATINTRVEFVMSLREGFGSPYGIFGARESYGSLAYAMFVDEQRLVWDYSNTFNKLSYYNDVTVPFYISADTSSVSVGGTVNTYNYTDTSASGLNMYLFAVNQSGTPLYPNSSLDIYFFRILEDGNLEKNFIPIINTDTREACLLEMESQQIYCNLGSGSFIYG